MSELSDIDRPVQRFHFGPWGREVAMRPPPAMDLLMLYREHEGDEQRQEQQLQWFATLLARTMLEPAASVDEWAAQVRIDTLTALGTEVLRRSGLDVAEKKSD